VQRVHAIVLVSVVGMVGGWITVDELASAQRSDAAVLRPGPVEPRHGDDDGAGSRPTSRAISSCEDLERERASITLAQKQARLHHEVVRARIAAARGEPAWPADVPRGLSAADFETTMLAACDELDVDVEELDCTQYPCFAVLDRTTSDTKFYALIELLKSRCGESLREYGAVRFGAQASYAVGCLPRTDEDDDELQGALRERAMARLAERP